MFINEGSQRACSLHRSRFLDVTHRCGSSKKRLRGRLGGLGMYLKNLFTGTLRPEVLSLSLLLYQFQIRSPFRQSATQPFLVSSHNAPHTKNGCVADYPFAYPLQKNGTFCITPYEHYIVFLNSCNDANVRLLIIF